MFVSVHVCHQNLIRGNALLLSSPEGSKPFTHLATQEQALCHVLDFGGERERKPNMTGFRHDPVSADANLIADDLDPSPRRFRKEVGLSEERASALASARGTSKLWAAGSQTPINLAPVALGLWTSVGVASRLAPTAFGLAWWRSVSPDQRNTAVCLA